MENCRIDPRLDVIEPAHTGAGLAARLQNHSVGVIWTRVRLPSSSRRAPERSALLEETGRVRSLAPKQVIFKISHFYCFCVILSSSQRTEMDFSCMNMNILNLVARHFMRKQTLVGTRAANDPSVSTITEKAPTMAFFWLKAPV